MKRRTWLQSIAALLAVQPLARFRLFAQAPTTSQLAPDNIRTLRAIAEVVLPASIGPSGRDRAVSEFVTWVRNYKEGADMGHSYGASRLSTASGASPAARYPAQFAALDTSADVAGVASFAGLPLDRRRALIEAALNTPPRVTRMPARPTGANLIADFMGFYFNGADGYNVAYNAAIDRDTCRSLDGSDKAPEVLR